MSFGGQLSSPVLPDWIRGRKMRLGDLHDIKRRMRRGGLHTVCEEARCPNRGECWSHRVVTFMIMGKTCTRNCAFCAIGHGTPEPLDPDEPRRLAEAAAKLGARHVVITSVTRDDLPDEGAGHFAASVRAVAERQQEVTVEVLPPDLHARAECIDRI